MNILIVEDRKDKRQNIKKVIREMGINDIEIAKTYFSARNKILILRKPYDLIVLDMFLPDAKDNDELRGLAGKDLIFDMKNQGIEVPVLVVTQYTEYTNNPMLGERGTNKIPTMMENHVFGKDLEEYRKEIYDCTYFEGLHEYLVSEVSMYLGIVFYSNQFKDWEHSLKYFVNKIRGNV